MPVATVTSRELKNKNTEIDLSVPTYKEIPGRLMTSVEYHVVVVSRLQCFKSPKHKESDIVQYMVPRKLQDFENLKAKLDKNYSGTMFPTLPKMALLVDDQVLQERRNRLDDFVKFLASTPKLCSCPLLLEFLGVSAIKAGKYRKGEVKSTGEEGDLFEEDQPTTGIGDAGQNSALFDETEEGDTDLFTENQQETSDDLFALPTDQSHEPSIQLFNEPDFGGGLTKEEEDRFLLPSAKVDQKKDSLFDDEDNSELLNIEDDLSDLLTLSNKPKASPKPSTKPKPPLAAKPKPQVAAKPRPAPKPRTSKLQKPSTNNKTEDLFSLETDKQSVAMGNDDILKYIQDNTAADEEPLDLF